LRNYKHYLLDIAQAVTKIIEYTKGATLENFVSDGKTMDAVVRNLEIIGEAAKNLPDEIKSKYNEIDWKAIVGMRNIVIHEYFGVDPDEIWQTIREDIPILQDNIKNILANEKQ